MELKLFWGSVPSFWTQLEIRECPKRWNLISENFIKKIQLKIHFLSISILTGTGLWSCLICFTRNSFAFMVFPHNESPQ